MLVYTGIIPLRLYNFNIFTVLIGLSIIPIQFPFTNTFVKRDKFFGEYSVINFKGVFARNHFIMGYDEKPFVITELIAICL